MKSKKIIAIASVALFTAGYLINPEVVDASKHKVELVRNSIIYTAKGKKTKTKLKKGKKVSYTSSKWIKGNKYYKIGKNKYIRQANTAEPILFTVVATLDDDAGVIYSKPGKLAKNWTAVSGGNVYEQYRDSKGTLWYRVGSHSWIKAKYTNKPNGKNVKSTNKKNTNKKSKTSHKVNKKSTKKSGTKYDSSKNAASLMDFLASNASLSASQKTSAEQAAKLLKTGEFNSQSAPSWFNKYVSLTSKNDATSAENIKSSLAVLEKVNKVRQENGLSSLKVSPVITAIAMINADYQKQGGLHHPDYYQTGTIAENMSSGGDAVNNWMGEKKNWNYDVKKNPSLAQYEHHANSNSDYQAAFSGLNGYQTAGHYLNLMNSSYSKMGAGNLSGISAVDFDSGYADDSLSFNQYKQLVNDWLKK